MDFQNEIVDKFKHRYLFIRRFMKWLRTKMITCWDTNAREFDKDLINEKHLIRCELSKNKLGYKTFLGYTHNDISFVPYICNMENKVYPKLGEIRLSTPNDIEDLVKEFMGDMETKVRKSHRKRIDTDLRTFFENKGKLRPEVEVLLSEEFRVSTVDGRKRVLFVLINELKKTYDIDKARKLCLEWNERMDNPMRVSEIEYRLKAKDYTLTTKYIQDLIDILK